MAVRDTAERPTVRAPGPAARRIRGLDAEQRQSQRRGQLLDAALDLFAANGYLATSIEQICQTAYVGTKGFYELFDSKEHCFLELLRSISENLMRDITDAWNTAPDDERAATRVLLETLCHGLVDDVRVARVTFGQASGISGAVERQRRLNRRWAAAFVVAFWERHHGPGRSATEGQPAETLDRYPMAIGLVGGLFDIIGDWLLDAGPVTPADTEILLGRLTVFFEVVRAGLVAADG